MKHAYVTFLSADPRVIAPRSSAALLAHGPQFCLSKAVRSTLPDPPLTWWSLSHTFHMRRSCFAQAHASAIIKPPCSVQAFMQTASTLGHYAPNIAATTLRDLSSILKGHYSLSRWLLPFLRASHLEHCDRAWYLRAMSTVSIKCYSAVVFSF